MNPLIRFYIIIGLATSYSLASQDVCNYSKQNCKNGFHCINYDKGIAKCIADFKEDLVLSVRMPFNSLISVECDQGVIAPPGNSHSWLNTGYAIDLHTPKDNSGGEVVASISGTVISFDSCKTENDQCGEGFGNHIKILNENGFIAFYAHLKTVNVKTGDKVKVGEVVGVEGMTGLTGKDNKHLHFSLHYNWKSNGFNYWKQVGYLPPSVPFKLLICSGDCNSSCRISEIDVRKLKCRRTSDQVEKMCFK